MKMEVLSVQNQFQGQFSVMGSAKVKDWTTPLTPPSTHRHHHNHHNHHQELPNTLSHSSSSANNNAATVINSVEEDATLQALTMRLQSELRTAKSRHLACTEVLLPFDLLERVASEMIVMSEKEPCGIRGCTVYIEFEDEPSNTRRIASLQVDPNMVSTFELYLTLRHDRSGWTSLLPQFLKNLARSSTIMISPDFIITKNKLYRSFSE